MCACMFVFLNQANTFYVLRGDLTPPQDKCFHEFDPAYE